VRIVILAERFEKGAWRYWEHECDRDEIRAFEDFAFTNGLKRGSFAATTSVDYLRGGEYLFNTMSDPREPPIEGDIRVFGAQVNRIVIARHDELRLYYQASRMATGKNREQLQPGDCTTKREIEGDS
jgi:hypothetical protein